MTSDGKNKKKNCFFAYRLQFYGDRGGFGRARYALSGLTGSREFLTEKEKKADR